jgi:cyanophycinase
MFRSSLCMIVVLTQACREPDEPGGDSWRDSPAPGDSGDSGDIDTGPEPVQGVVVLAGGGSEGDRGEQDSWSARLYAALLEGGDVTGDGALRVAVLSTAEESAWLPEYFEWLGADEAFNLRVSSREEADACTLSGRLQGVDAVFVKGGDQGEYYDLWHGTALERVLRSLSQERGGGIGGTSAGAMALAGYALAGGQDLVSLDVLEDACTPWLDDASDGGSAIHDDFLGIVPGVIVDTHFTQRGRLGRLAGAMARAIDEGAPVDLLGIGIEQQTGVVMRAGVADVVGAGAVSFLAASEESILVRDCGHPLVFSDLVLHRLTDGWSLDIWAGGPPAPPAGAEAMPQPGASSPNVGAWMAYGDQPEHEERFAWVAERDPLPFALREGSDVPVLEAAVAFVDPHGAEVRALSHEVLFRALYERPGLSGFLLPYGARLERSEERPSLVRFEDNDLVGGDPQAACVVVSNVEAQHRGLAPAPSLYDAGDGSLSAAAVSDLRVHILAESARVGLAYDAEARAVVPW